MKHFCLMIAICFIIISCPLDTSPAPGSTWTAHTLPSSASWTALAYGNGVFVAITYNNNIAAYSSDGVTWNTSTLPGPASSAWSSITYGSGGFVAVASDYNCAAVSTNGTSWTPSTAIPFTGLNHWNAVAYGTYGGIGRYIVVSIGSQDSATSPDGVTWTPHNTLPSTSNWLTLAYGNNVFVAFDMNGQQATSTDGGLTWTGQTVSGSGFWQSTAFGNGTFVTITGTTADQTTATSSNGSTWNVHTNALPSSQFWNSVAYGNGVFVAIAGEGSSAAATSTDGITWTARTLPYSDYWNAVTYGNGRFVAVAGGPVGNRVATSP